MIPNPKQVTHILIDTNSMPEGHFDGRRFETMARICDDNDLTLCVPEVVLWEWQEHSSRMLREFDDTLKRLQKRLGWCIPPIPPLPVPEDVTRRLHRTVVARSHIIKASGPAAIRGLHDQVLQVGSGTTRGGTKTGAADSAWISAAIELAEEADLLLVVSADRPVLSEIERRSSGSILTSTSFSSAVDELQLVQATPQRQPQLERILLEWFSADARIEQVSELWELARPVAQAAYFDQHDPDFYEAIQSIRASRLTAVSLTDIRRVGRAQSFFASIALTFDIAIDTAGYDSDGAADYHHYEVTNLVASGDVVIIMSDHSEVDEVQFDASEIDMLLIDESGIVVM